MLLPSTPPNKLTYLISFASSPTLQLNTTGAWWASNRSLH
jgi:hypothetical protein